MATHRVQHKNGARMKVLLVDDERSIRVTLGDALEEAGHTVVCCENAAQARELIAQAEFECVVTDLQLPDGNGIELLPLARELNPHCALLVITAHQTIETAIQATKAGADYLIKPFLNEEVVARLRNIDETRVLKAEIAQLKTQVSSRVKIDRIVGKSPRMQEIFNTIETVGPSDATVLITGESGTGKVLVAEALHRNSPRCSRPLIKVSCAALPESLLEDELFGHEKGAFADASDRKLGRFELANGGSIFLDDIDDMNLSTQMKLLRVLQEREFERVGGTKTVHVDVRVIVATKGDLSVLVQQGRFREDLCFRLRVVEVNLPPLRERREDVPLLLQHFVRLHGNGRVFEIAPQTVLRMCEYTWPGNVRELENAVLRAIALAGSSNALEERYLLQAPPGLQLSGRRPTAGTSGSYPAATPYNAPQPAMAGAASGGFSRMGYGARPGSAASSGNMRAVGTMPISAATSSSAFHAAVKDGTISHRPLREIVADAERSYIQQALVFTGGNKTRAAILLDISRKNLWEKMRDLGMLPSSTSTSEDAV